MATQRKTMEMRVLKVDLGDDELEARGRELAVVVQDQAGQEAALEKALERHKAEKKELEALLKETSGRLKELSRSIVTRTVTRDVPCDWRFDLDRKVKFLVRRDTGEAVERKALTDQECQLLIGEQLEAVQQKQLDAWAAQLKAAESVKDEDKQEEPEKDEEDEA